MEVEGARPALEKLRVLRAEGRIVLYYSEFSLLEAIAKAVKLNVPRSVVEYGVTAITAGYRKAGPRVEAWLLAAELRREGLRDLIDALLYAMASTGRLQLLTRDRRLLELLEFLEEHGYPTTVVMREEQLLES
ncbi:PIN domain-containing protein [Pyrodictium abyssi]|uniref:PIN domain-containing protein n=1 Tax=Pyrodictium abyssi TaxID=54256 RepID=A0ABM8J0L6_9CREN|nr:hypothetical protein PABY_24620 [Pyrodictium abyssi]